MEVAYVLAEILEGGYTAFCFLDFVEEEQCLANFDFYLIIDLYSMDDALDVKVAEECGCKGVIVTVDIDDVLEFLPAKFFEDIGLSDLTGSQEHKWFANR